VAEVETESGLPPVRAPGEVVAAGPPARLPYTDAPVRRGSPFAAPTRSPVAETPAPYEPAPAAGPTQYPQHTASIGGAYACLLLGVVSVVGSFSLRSFPPAPLVTAVIGMGMGTWGLYSKHRMAAVVGLLLCCVAIALASFFGAVLLYEMIHGRDPFAPDLPVEEIDVL
jgi:hypothetical protein